MKNINSHDPKFYTTDELRVMGKRLRLSSVIEHAADLSSNPLSTDWSINQWLGTLFESEIERREGLALTRRLKDANLEFADASYSLIDKDPARQLDMTRINTLFSLDWVGRKQNCIITGTTGTGKTWMADAICREACIKGYRVKSYRMHTLLRMYARFQKPTEAGSDMQLKFLRDLTKFDVLHIDDWAVATGIDINPTYRTGLYEIINQCSGRTSVLTSGVPPVETWAAFIGDPTVADSILDRLVQRAVRLELKEPSLREKEIYGGVPLDEQLK